MSMNIVGISALYHNSACCLIQDGRLTAAAEEERFSRRITGKIINPKLYIAIGISGSNNHMIGISNTTKIIAINTDAEAEIIKVADYKIIADAKEFLENVIQRIVV